MRYIAALVLFALAGCATGPEYVWSHPSKDANEFETDNGFCDAQASPIVAQCGFSIYCQAIYQKTLRACLKGKGWRLVEKTKFDK